MGRFECYVLFASVNAFFGLQRIGMGDISQERKKIEALLELIEQALMGFENREKQQRGESFGGTSFTEVAGWDGAYEVLSLAFPLTDSDSKSRLLRIRDVLNDILEERSITIGMLEGTIRIISKAISKLSESSVWDAVKSGLGSMGYRINHLKFMVA